MNSSEISIHKSPEYRPTERARLNGIQLAGVLEPIPESAEESALDSTTAPIFRYRLLGSADLENLPPMEWLLQDVLPSQGLAAIYGPSGSGKSFLALDLSVALAEGTTWFGHSATQSPVIYIALEGEQGVPKRVAAWERFNARRIPSQMKIVMQAFELLNAGDAEDVSRVVRHHFPEGAVVVIDTLSRAAVGADENASVDMGRLISAAKALQALIGGLVLLVHHSGKDLARGMRGHSSLFAALDAVIETRRNGRAREWQLNKAKDAHDDHGHRFELIVVELGINPDGSKQTSCVVRPLETTAVNQSNPKGATGANQQIMLEGVRDLLENPQYFGQGGAPDFKPCVGFEEAVRSLCERLGVDAKRQPERAREAMKGLIKNGLIHSGDGWLWLP